MKVLTVKQPWANMILSGHKDLENRKWSTNFRGRLLIHSSAQIDKYAMQKYQDLGLVHEDDCLRGYIIGSVKVVDVLDLKNKSTPNKWWDGSAYGWLLENPQWCMPLSVKGKLKLWEIDYDAKPK